MSITKSLTFSGININGVSYTPFLDESVEVTVEPIVDMVNNGQSLPSAYNVSFGVNIYNTNILTDSNVYTNTAAAPVLASVVFTGGTGGQTLTISNVIIHATQVFDAGRSAYRIGGSKRETSLTTGVVLT
jgi:hypothetical protein